MKKIFIRIKILISKIIFIFLPLLGILRLRFIVSNRLDLLRFQTNKIINFDEIISKLTLKKMIALDVGAQGGFNSDGDFLKKYNNFFKPILVEPIPSEAKKLKNDYKIIKTALWSNKATSTYCKKFGF